MKSKIKYIILIFFIQTSVYAQTDLNKQLLLIEEDCACLQIESKNIDTILIKGKKSFKDNTKFINYLTALDSLSKSYNLSILSLTNETLEDKKWLPLLDSINEIISQEYKESKNVLLCKIITQIHAVFLADKNLLKDNEKKYKDLLLYYYELKDRIGKIKVDTSDIEVVNIDIDTVPVEEELVQILKTPENSEGSIFNFSYTVIGLFCTIVILLLLYLTALFKIYRLNKSYKKAANNSPTNKEKSSDEKRIEEYEMFNSDQKSQIKKLKEDLDYWQNRKKSDKNPTYEEKQSYDNNKPHSIIKSSVRSEEVILYVEVPNEDNFIISKKVFKQKNNYTFYKIKLKTKESTSGEIYLVTDHSLVERAEEYFTEYILPVCDTDNNSNSINLSTLKQEPGLVEKSGDDWSLTKKINLRW